MNINDIIKGLNSLYLHTLEVKSAIVRKQLQKEILELNKKIKE